MSRWRWVVMATLAYSGSPFANGCYSAPYDCRPVGDIAPDTGHSYAERARAYAQFAWQDFMALNFPAATGADGHPLPEPSTMRGLGDHAGCYTAVWQVYPEARDLFRPGGQPPAQPFGSGHDVPDICIAAGRAARLSAFRRRRDRLGDNMVLDEYIQADLMGPVIDSSGHYVRYGIHFNRPMFNYIVGNQLYSQEGQSQFDAHDLHRDHSKVHFPRGRYDATVGSIFIKAAWKILDAHDDPLTFYRVRAYVYDAPGGAFHDEPTVTAHCEVRTMGLVGFHIVHFTQSAPQGVWSTFEHRDNAPWLADFKMGTPVRPYSFFNPTRCPSVSGQPACRYNVLPPQPWNPQRPGQAPTQLVRIAAPGAWAIEANRAVRRALRQYEGQTVWDHYFLVDVQFPTAGKSADASGRADPDGAPTPTLLANTTMETYIPGFHAREQTTNGKAVPSDDRMTGVVLAPGPVDPWQPRQFNRAGGAPRVTSSCIGCHLDASMATGAAGDFVFALDRAQRLAPVRNSGDVSLQRLERTLAPAP